MELTGLQLHPFGKCFSLPALKILAAAPSGSAGKAISLAGRHFVFCLLKEPNHEHN